MSARTKKSPLWIILATLAAIVVETPIASVSASSSTTLAAPILLDKTLKPGSTFSINITVANVTSMLGYQFVLNYDTSVLTATGYCSYLPFDCAWPSKISDVEGYVAVAHSMPFPEYLPQIRLVSVPLL